MTVRGKITPWTKAAATIPINISCTRRIEVLKIVPGTSTRGEADDARGVAGEQEGVGARRAIELRDEQAQPQPQRQREGEHQRFVDEGRHQHDRGGRAQDRAAIARNTALESTAPASGCAVM